MEFDAIIVGGGAAGLFCAAEAAKRGRTVLLIEHNAQLGRKIIISGGGRCNFTNLDVRPENFVSSNPHFCKSALARYTPQDFIKIVEKYRIRFYDKTLGQLFCRERSFQIVDMLVAECSRGEVEILTDCSVKKIDYDEVFTLKTNKGIFRSPKLVIATGGLSFPKIGATDFGYRIAKQFGLSVTEIRPSLVPLRFADKVNFSKLAGVSIDCAVEFEDAKFRENLLFTHRGLSGPAILQISNYWVPRQPVKFDLLPGVDAVELLEKNGRSRQTVSNFLGRHLPKRFAEEFTAQDFANKRLNQLNKKEFSTIAESLNNWQVLFSETEGWHKAEVTLGGIDTDEISSQTMESKKIPGLYFIGEVLDVTGWLGGYNFQWAWSSAYACGTSI